MSSIMRACPLSTMWGYVQEGGSRHPKHATPLSYRNGVIDKSELRNLLEAVSSDGETSTAQGWVAARIAVHGKDCCQSQST